nr:hypothetical protein CFP56_27596 [Quercus suber]
MDIHGEWQRTKLVLAAAVATKAIWRSRYGRGRVAVAATMVGRMAGKEDEVLGSQENIRESKIFLAK